MNKYRVYLTPDWFITVEASYVYVGSFISFHRDSKTIAAFLPEKIIGFCIEKEEKDA